MEVVHKPVSGQIYTYACRGVGISQEKKLYQSEYETTDGWKGNTQWKSGTLSAASNGGRKSRPTIVMYVCERKSSVKVNDG